MSTKLKDHMQTEIAVKQWQGELIPGLLLTLAFAAISYLTWYLLRGTWVKSSALLWAFVYSIIAANVFPRLAKGSFRHGIEFVSSRMLRLTIALLGLTVSALVWVSLGGIGVAVVIANLAFAFLFGVLVCHYVLKLEGTLPLLLAAGTAICGATAIAATGPAVRSKGEEMGLAVAVITLFGLAAMFLYPVLFAGPLGDWLENNPLAFGMWAGTGIHETAQVIAASSQVDHALSIAVSAKFIRIFMIGPMIFLTMAVFRRFNRKNETRIKMAVPWFAVAFIMFTLVNFVFESLIGTTWKTINGSFVQPAVTFLLAWSLAAIGFKVRLSSIRAIGLKSFLGGMVVALVAGITALLLVKYVWLPLN